MILCWRSLFCMQLQVLVKIWWNLGPILSLYIFYLSYLSLLAFIRVFLLLVLGFLASLPSGVFVDIYLPSDSDEAPRLLSLEFTNQNFIFNSPVPPFFVDTQLVRSKSEIAWSLSFVWWFQIFYFFPDDSDWLSFNHDFFMRVKKA